MAATVTEKTEDPVQPKDQGDSLNSLKYQLLGPSLTKAGQDRVDQSKVSDIIYNASKGSKFFNHEEVRDKTLTTKIEQILEHKRELEKQGLTRDLRHADRLITELDVSRDLTQHVIHIDCDAFYAAVEQLDRPELQDVPFAVGGGVLTTCNYVARKFGCRSGMASFVAKKLCPDLLLIKPNFEKYTAKAHQVRQILAEYDARYESASIDEAYLNITDYCTENGLEPAEVVDQMRRTIHQKTDITVSAGIAANTKLAKICSNMNKPNGQYVLQNDRNAIMAFMHDLPTRKVNGIGRVLERQLLEIGVKTCGEIYEQRGYLCKLFGEKTFEFLLHCYLGLGRTRIQPAEDYERKSVGTESTFGEMSDPAKLREKLRWTAEELEKDMKRAECKGRTLCLKVKLSTFDVFTRQVMVPRAIWLEDDLYNYALPMLVKLEQDMPGMKLRLMGLRCTHLVSTRKPDTMAFFGLKQPMNATESQEGLGCAKRKATQALDGDDDRDRRLPGEEPCPDGADDGPERKPSDCMDDSDSRSPGRKDRDMAPHPKMHMSEPEEGWWDCPICHRPQTANERHFNEHIDLCLSRQTIRDAVQEDGPERTWASPPRNKRPRVADTRRVKASTADHKQKRLFFGRGIT